MNKVEVAKLLTLASAIDNRKVEPETVRMWEPLVGHLPLDVAVEAMQKHFQESDKYLMPAHIVANSRRVFLDRERSARVNGPRAITKPVITLDREKFELETQAAIEAHRASR